MAKFKPSLLSARKTASADGSSDATPEEPDTVETGADAVDVGALRDMMGYALKRAQMAVFEDFLEALSETDLRPAQFSVLLLLDQSPGLTQSAVAQTLGIQRANFVPMIVELERRGLAQRTASLRDRRSHALYLTPQGADLLERAKSLHEAHQNRVLSTIGSGNARLMFEMLSKLATDLKDKRLN